MHVVLARPVFANQLDPCRNQSDCEKLDSNVVHPFRSSPVLTLVTTPSMVLLPEDEEEDEEDCVEHLAPQVLHSEQQVDC